MKARLRFYNFEEDTYSLSVEDLIGVSSVEVDSVEDTWNSSAFSDILFRALNSDDAEKQDANLWNKLSRLYISDGAEVIDDYFGGFAENTGEIEFEYTLEVGDFNQKMKVLLFVSLRIEDEYDYFLKDFIGTKLLP